jgi:putative hydrolase of HD superfamily
MKSNIHRLIELQRLLLAFSQVDRMTHRQHEGKFIHENDTEHSYNLAMTAWYICQYFPKLNKDLVIQYALVHDLVEIYAGDTYIYASQDELASKQQRETDALVKLDAQWSDFAEMNDTIRTYEESNDSESKFVYALDKIMPIMLIYIHDGYTWKKEGVTAQMLYEAKHSKIATSPEILPYFSELYELLLSRPDLIKKS